MKTIRYHGHRNIISSRLVEARKKQGLSQEELAARLQILGAGIDQQAISKIEHDNRIVTDYELLYFCKALKIELSWLLGNFAERLFFCKTSINPPVFR